MAFSSDSVCWFAARKPLCVYSFYITWPLSKSFECQKCTVIIFPSLAFCKCKVFTCQQVQGGRITEAVPWTRIVRHTSGSPGSWQMLSTVWLMGDLGWSDRKLLWRWNADQTHVEACNLWHQSWQPASISLSSWFLSPMSVQTGLRAEEEVFIFIICSPCSLSTGLWCCVTFTEVFNPFCSDTPELCSQLQLR